MFESLRQPASQRFKKLESPKFTTSAFRNKGNNEDNQTIEQNLLNNTTLINWYHLIQR